MVKVYFHVLVGYLEHLSLESVAVLILQRQHSSHEYVFAVEGTVHVEYLLFQCHHPLFEVFSVGVLHLQFQFEFLSAVKGFHRLFELCQCHSETA